MATLIKTDRNGTKYYEGLVTCDRCNGRGLFIVRVENNRLIPAQPDSGVCYKCGGRGKVMGAWKEYTEEYRAKLDAQNAKGAAKKKAELEEKRKAEYESNGIKWLAEHGFTPDGFTYLFLGDTYAVKDQIKEAGGKYTSFIGWHADHEISGMYSIKVHVDELAERTYLGYYQYNADCSEWQAKKEAAYKELSGAKASNHYGSVGDKVQLSVELVRVAFFKGYMGATTTVYTMKDADGNLFVWKTTANLERVENGEYHNIEKGEHFTVKCTIKEHSEYKGEKQTVLTRCRVA